MIFNQQLRLECAWHSGEQESAQNKLREMRARSTQTRKGFHARTLSQPTCRENQAFADRAIRRNRRISDAICLRTTENEDQISVRRNRQVID